MEMIESTMTEMERNELMKRMMALSLEEQTITIQTMPTTLLFQELYDRFCKMDDMQTRMKQIIGV